MATYRLPENREAPPFLETELIPPLFVSFERIFNALEEPFPEPELGMGIGYKGPKPAYDVEPNLHAEFKGSLIKASVSTTINLKERNRIYNLALGPTKKWEITPERIVIDVVEASAAPPWQLLFDRETALTAFQKNFRPDSPHVRWNLNVMPHGSITPPRESLRISFPDSELIDELGLLVPKVDYETEGNRPLAQSRRAIRYREQLRTFAGSVLKELNPFLDYWYTSQRGKFSKNKAFLRVLKERDRRVSEILRFVSNPPAVRG